MIGVIWEITQNYNYEDRVKHRVKTINYFFNYIWILMI